MFPKSFRFISPDGYLLKSLLKACFLKKEKNLEDDWMNLLTITFKRIIQICKCQFHIHIRWLATLTVFWGF